ncbi:hypothetical protein GBAR_LOCUS27640 [Geodia barretti]|uniref:Uncharacterized protein n=1 Tax=Geodia barretti TaxID=519541 RepID=A0AA35TLQ6_GEOBA|nr:hypothetical protein GBAR_LOCUS27640 [Geodia barretti]
MLNGTPRPWVEEEPPPVPTSHNFTKQRDKMRHKLEEKRREKELNRPYNPQHNCSETDSRPLDELLAFIEGDERGEGAESCPSP